MRDKRQRALVCASGNVTIQHLALKCSDDQARAAATAGTLNAAHSCGLVLAVQGVAGAACIDMMIAQSRPPRANNNTKCTGAQAAF